MYDGDDAGSRMSKLAMPLRCAGRTARCWMRTPVLAFALLLAAWLVGTAESAVAAEAPASAPPAAATIADTVMQIGKSEKLQRTALARLEQSGPWRDLSLRTTALETEFDRLALGTVAQAELMELLGLEHQARELKDAASAIVDELASIVRRLEQDGNELETHARLWRERLVFLHDRLVPAPVIERAQEVEAALRSTGDQLRKVRDRTLLDLARALALQLRVVEASSLVNARLDHVRLQRIQLEESSLWQIRATPSQFQSVTSELRSGARLLRQYLALNGIGFAGLFFSIFAFTWWLFTKGAPQDAAPAQRAYGRPVAASLLIALMSLWWLAPDPPAVFYEILLAIVPIPAAMIARRTFAAAIPLSLYGLAFATSLLSLRNSIESSVIADRVLLLLQAISIGVPVAVDLRRGRLQQAFASWSPDIVRIVALIAIALSVVTAWHVIFGFVGPARSLRANTGSILGFSLVFGTTALALYGAALAILGTPVLSWLRSARNADPALLHAVRLVLILLTVIGVGLVTVESLSLVPALRSAIDSLMGSTLEVGAVSISAKAVAAALAIVLATLALTMVIGFVLDREVFPRLQLRPGTGYAIATFTHWVMLITIELELQAQNALRVAVLRKLDKAGIVTPSATARGSAPPGERTTAPDGTSTRT